MIMQKLLMIREYFAKTWTFLKYPLLIYAIGTIVAFYMLPNSYHQCYLTSHSKYSRAGQDCDTIAQAVSKFINLEKRPLTSLIELEEKYLPGISHMRDPWGHHYRFDPLLGFVFSQGEDGRDEPYDRNSPVNKDNIKVPFLSRLHIVRASLEVNPTGETNPFWARDLLHLQFNKPFLVSKKHFNLNKISVSEDSNCIVSNPSGINFDRSTYRFTFRWFRGKNKKPIDGAAILRQPGPDGEPAQGEPDSHQILNISPPGPVTLSSPRLCEDLETLDPWTRPFMRNKLTGTIFSAGPDGRFDPYDSMNPDNDDNLSMPLSNTGGSSNNVQPLFGIWNETIPLDYISCNGKPPKIMDGGLYVSRNRVEAVIILPAGTSGSILPGEFYIDLTGNRKSFLESSMGQIFREMDYVTTAISAWMAVQIEIHEK